MLARLYVVMDLLYVAVIAAAFSTVVLYVTWLFIHHLRTGQPKARSFLEWMKGLLDAMWGLG